MRTAQEEQAVTTMHVITRTAACGLLAVTAACEDPTMKSMSTITRIAACGLLAFTAACNEDQVVGPISAASAGSMVVATAASATAPEQVTFPMSFEDYIDCSDAMLHLTYAGTLRIAQFYGRLGEPVRETIRVLLKGTVTNLSTGESVRDDENFTIMYDLVGGTHSINGATAHITVPGQGIVLHNAGRIAFDENGIPRFIAGPHTFPGPAEYCSALT